MDADEAEVCEFLKSWPDQFVSAREICRRAGSKWRYREDERWALPVLQRLVEKHLVEADAAGHYRLLVPKKTEKKRSAPSKGLADYGVIDLDEELGLEATTGSGSISLLSTENAGFAAPGLV